MKLPGIVVSSMLSAPLVFAVSISELDDFNAPNGAPNPQEGWREGDGSQSQPLQQLTGGPDGSGFLIDSSTGISPGKRMQFWNTDQWTGDYLGQSISTLSLDAINLSGPGGETINLRVALNGPGGWFVTEPQALLPETGWQPLLFDLSPSGLVHAGQGNAVYESTMASVNRLQIISLKEDTYNFGDNAGLRGDTIEATLGLDNIKAVGAIPEPSGGVTIPTLTHDGETTTTLTWDGVTGKSYQVEYSDDLENWFSDLSDSTFNNVPDNSLLTFTDPAGPSTRYYRIVSN